MGLDSLAKFITITDRFYPDAKKLRQVFDAKFKNPKAASSARFVWDYWHVPEQYTFVRTPAEHYFPKNTYSKFQRHLIDWGRKVLGCRAISPPWLSYYVEGCAQELHSDVPHGPWAFVYSLTTGNKFSGGETRILRPETLDYWSAFQDAKDRELNSFEARIASPFNRLTVFDPRFPHGVTEVRGVKDPREGRLVVHGWFTEPSPYCEGALPANKVTDPVNESLASLGDHIDEFGRVHGCMSVRAKIAASGKITDLAVLANSVILLDAPSDHRAEKEFSKKIIKVLKSMKFSKARGITQLTIPLLFR